MRLFLVRHARTALNDKGLALGQMDVDIDEVGQEQLDKLQRRFVGIPLTRIISSDLLRCRKTAAALSEATGAPIEYTAVLRERSFGDWERESYAWVSEQIIEMAKQQNIPWQHVKPPGGESHLDVWHRTHHLIEEMFHAEGEVALVTHGGISTVLLAQLVKGTLASTRSFGFANTAVTELESRPEGSFLMLRYNDTSHLEDQHHAEGAPKDSH